MLVYWNIRSLLKSTLYNYSMDYEWRKNWLKWKHMTYLQENNIHPFSFPTKYNLFFKVVYYSNPCYFVQIILQSNLLWLLPVYKDQHLNVPWMAFIIENCTKEAPAWKDHLYRKIINFISLEHFCLEQNLYWKILFPQVFFINRFDCISLEETSKINSSSIINFLKKHEYLKWYMEVTMTYVYNSQKTIILQGKCAIEQNSTCMIFYNEKIRSWNVKRMQTCHKFCIPHFQKFKIQIYMSY